MNFENKLTMQQRKEFEEKPFGNPLFEKHQRETNQNKQKSFQDFMNDISRHESEKITRIILRSKEVYGRPNVIFDPIDKVYYEYDNEKHRLSLSSAFTSNQNVFYN